MMYRMLRIFFTLVLLSLLLASALAPVQAESERRAPTASNMPPIQYWRMGFAQQLAPDYASTAGRMASISAEMRSNRNVLVYFAFPAVASRRFVNEVNFYILSRSGAYSGVATMQLEIYDYAGALQHVVSAASVDLQAAIPQVWTKLALANASDNRLLEPGEFLAFRFALDGATGGDLDVHPLFEVAVGPLQLYLPVFRR